jgi:YebC/PmpR family DNA-binding regulatory protein
MAGHSKWANIQHRKKAQDAKRGKLFTKLIREIVVATKEAGPDKDTNPRLRLAIDKAFQGNMTRDTIDKAIARGAGNQDDSQFFEVVYEGYAPHGIAVLVQCLTDNRNRTVGEVRHIFNKYGGNLGTEGSVSYLFNTQGMIVIENQDIDPEALIEAAITLGAEDFETADEHTYVFTPREDFNTIYAALQKDYTVAHAAITRIPESKLSLTAEEAANIYLLVEKLDDLDDVQDVYTNLANDEDAQ